MSWQSGGNWDWGTDWKAYGRRSRRHDFQPIEQAEDTRITSEMSPVEIELRIRRRIERRQVERNSFISSLIGYAIVNIILWSIYAGGIGDFFFFWGLPWPVFVTLFWGISLARRGYSFYQNTPERVAQREDRIQQEVDRMKARLGYAGSDDYYGEKPKNDEKAKNDDLYHAPIQPLQLSTDGELIPDEIEPAESLGSDSIGSESRDDRPRFTQSDSQH